MIKIKINHILIYRAMYEKYHYSPHSSKKLADKLHLTVKQINDFLFNINKENNRPLPRLTILWNVTQALNLKIDDVIEEVKE